MYQCIVSRLQQVSHHLVMSQMWPLLRARFLGAHHMGICTFTQADRRLPGGDGRVAGDMERLCARAHGRSALPGTGRAVVPGGERSGNWSANRRAGAPQRKKRLLLSVVSFVESTRYFPFPSGARNRELTNRRGVQVYRGWVTRVTSQYIRPGLAYCTDSPHRVQHQLP